MKEEIRKILRSPEALEILHNGKEGELFTDSGKRFPIIEGIYCLLKEDERAKLDDKTFYDDHPFGERDWSNVSDVEKGVEEDLKDLLSEYKNSSLIIDVGSGSGRISNYLSIKNFENVVSLDYSFQSLKQVKKNSDNICVWASALCLPIKSNSFDLVICSGVIHHTPDPYKALAECVRILKPGGKLYLRTYNRASLYCLLYKTYGAFLRFFESNKSTRFFSDIFGFKPYKLARSLFYSLQERDNRIIRAQYANLLTKDTVYFFAESEIESLLKEYKMSIEDRKKSGSIHRSHCYVARKQS